MIALGLFGSGAHAQQPKASPYQAISDRFFELLQQDKPGEAIDYVFGTNPMMKRIPDQIEQLKAQFTSLSSKSVSGSYVSHAMLVESKVAGMFVYQHYFVAYERQPISMRITYYKPGATWVCQSVQFDANIPEVIRKAADSKIE